jgi:Arc/MetJ-type ribon-helix-helix transcriptional regulator
MSETGDRVDGPSRPQDETSDHPSGMIRQPALRARGKYVSKSDMVTDALRELITDRQLSPGTPLERPADTIHLRRLVSMLEEIWSRSWNSSKRTQPSNAARAASGKTTEILQRRPPRLRPHFPRAGSKDRRPGHAGS